MNTLRWTAAIGAAFFCAALGGGTLRAADEEAGKLSLADGALQFQVPKTWEKRKPKFNIIEAEFAAPAVGDDKTEVRITIMGASGTVDDNINRWLGQFQTADGAAVTKEGAKISNKKIGGLDVHFVDVAGTYLDKPFPQSPKAVPREKWRMLSAIIVSEKAGSYFVKLYGPAAAVAPNEAAFNDFLGSLKTK